MRRVWLLLFVSACAAVPRGRPAPTEPARALPAERVTGADDGSIFARIAYARDGATSNWLEIHTTGPAAEATRECERLVASEMGHALPPGFSASVQRRCDARSESDRDALSPLPYELADADVAEGGTEAAVHARYIWIERFAQASECEASRAAHEERRTREDLELKRSLSASVTPSTPRDARPRSLSCRHVGAR